MGYDIIGDVHGHAGRLQALLCKLGYREHAGAWRHPTRRAIFVGDLIDRGPRQVEAVELVRAMVEAGSAHAVMGNHEFNALGYHTEDPEQPGSPLRPHSDKNNREHQAFVDATEGRHALRRSILDWFMTLPLWLELPELRVVHACWEPDAMGLLEHQLRPAHRLDIELLAKAHRRGTPEYRAAEVILKGPEVSLPNGQAFHMGGRMRSEVRTRWWDAAATTYRASALVPLENRAELSTDASPAWSRPGYAGDRPLFIGHYQMRGGPRLDTARVACVDYPDSGRLTAYRWDGEAELGPANFVSVGQVSAQASAMAPAA